MGEKIGRGVCLDTPLSFSDRRDKPREREREMKKKRQRGPFSKRDRVRVSTFFFLALGKKKVLLVYRKQETRHLDLLAEGQIGELQKKNRGLTFCPFDPLFFSSALSFFVSLCAYRAGVFRFTCRSVAVVWSLRRIASIHGFHLGITDCDGTRTRYCTKKNTK